MSSLNSSSAKSKCLVCFAVFQSERCKNPEYFTTIFDVLCRLLSANLIEPIRWNFEKHGIPFCEFCCSAVKKLKQLNDQFELLQQQINHILHITKQNILKSANVFNNSLIASKDVNLTLLNRVHYLRGQVTGSSTPEDYSSIENLNKDPDNLLLDRNDCYSSVQSSSNTACNTIAEGNTYDSEVIDIKLESNNDIRSDFVGEGECCRPQDDILGDLDSIFLDPDDAARIQASVSESDSRTETEPEESTSLDKIVVSGSKKHKCDNCGRTFTKKSSLVCHIRIHTGEKPYKCEDCGKAYAHSNTLAAHVKTHTGEKLYKCEICARAFACSSYLATHARIHTGEKPYKCEVCHRAFAHPNTLAAHVRTHTGEKRYKCHICGRAFACSSYLVKHTTIHTGEKRYKCEICGRAFAHSNTLAAHLRTHTGEKPYKCEVCDKGFAQLQTLIDHRTVHTGEKNFKCELCNKSFTTSSNLRFHKRVHNNQLPP